MIPAAFDYEVAESVDHAIALLGEREDAKLLAGGHSLLPAMKLRLARPALLVDVGRLVDLSYVREEGDTIAIGALTRHKDVAESRRAPRALRDRVAHGRPDRRSAGAASRDDRRLARARRSGVGSPLSRDPRARTASSSLAARAAIVRSPAREFFTGVFQTALAPDEMLVEIRVPKLGSAGWSYTKMSRRAQDWATVAVAAVVRRERRDRTGDDRADEHGRDDMHAARGAEDALVGGSSIADAAALAAEGTEPSSDHAASADFRRHLARVLTRRALEEAAAH